MTERITLLDVSELKILRVTCHECSMTNEVNIAKANRAISSTGACTHCSATIADFSLRNPLEALRLAIETLEKSPKVTVGFAIGTDCDRNNR